MCPLILSLSSIDNVGPSSELDLCEGKQWTCTELLIKAAAVVSVWRGAESGLPLGNQFAKADAQQGTNFCGLRQLFSNTYQETFFFWKHLFLYSSTYQALLWEFWEIWNYTEWLEDLTQAKIKMTYLWLISSLEPMLLALLGYNLQLLVWTFFLLSFSCWWSWSTRYQFLMQRLQRWTGGDRWCDVGGHSEKFPESWTLMNSK